MQIRELGYVVLTATDLGQWQEFATKILGMMCSKVDATGLYLRMDDRDCRMIIKPGERDGLAAAGWLVDNRQALNEARSELVNEGWDVVDGSQEECVERRVRALIAVRDPAGVRHEIAWGPVVNYQEQFHPPVKLSGFVTGEQGLGHIVLSVDPQHFAAEEEFIEKILGFKLANFRKTYSLNPDKSAIALNFYHSGNGRQHTLAIAAAKSANPIQHLMLEVASIDDVGRAYDRVEKYGAQYASTLGRHVNDGAISFYIVSPGGFWFEYGYVPSSDEYQIPFDDGNRGSIWGHKFLKSFADGGSK